MFVKNKMELKKYFLFHYHQIINMKKVKDEYQNVFKSKVCIQSLDYCFYHHINDHK